MIPIDINIDGIVVKITYNDFTERYRRYSKNMQTGLYVAELSNGKVEINFTGNTSEIEHFMFRNINNMTVSNNEELFLLLETFL